MKPARFTKEDWLAFGLQQLASIGPEALKIGPLCAASQKTIGSFYHHFKDQQAYFEDLLAHWKEKNTSGVIRQLEALPEGSDKANQLEMIAMAMDQREDVGIRVLALQNEMVAAVVAEVDQMRVSFMQGLYQAQLDLSATEAEQLAQLEYAAFVGTQTIWPNGSLEQGQSLSALFQKLVAARFGESNTDR